MKYYQDYLKYISGQLAKALGHLDYSYNKIKKLSTRPDLLDEEGLATWESFSARFSRVVDIFLMKYLKAFVKQDDPGFSGSLRDFVNQAEKLKLIADANAWMKIRELRNITAHEYSDDNLDNFLQQLKAECQLLLELKVILDLNLGLNLDKKNN